MRGWPVIILASSDAEAVVLPGKGADIVSFRRASDGVNVLWSSPWGLRQRGAMSAATDSEGRLMEAYPGGWQTVFPNGGDAARTQNTTWGMHGEVWMAPFEVTALDGNHVELVTELVHSPFTVTKRITLEAARLTVTETIVNHARHPVDVMWSHHPAFGAPLLAAGSIVESLAHAVLADPGEDEATDLVPGRSSRWPDGAGQDGSTVDLSVLPGPDAALSRMAYLAEFDEGFVTVRNARLGIGARLEWDAAVMPYAWYWLEAGGSRGFPWYQRAYVLGIEPATTIPGHGLDAARHGSGPLTIAAGHSSTARVSLQITDGGPARGLGRAAG
jgi:hypothetical protein